MRAVMILPVGTLALIAGGLVLTGCNREPKETYVDAAWVRLGAVKKAPAVAYFTIHGGATPSTLIAVTTDVTINSEMHETMTRGAVASMKPLANVVVPADTKVVFRPGGRHVMLFDMNPGIKPGSTVALTLTFGNGDRIQRDANVIAAGDPAPK